MPEAVRDRSTRLELLRISMSSTTVLRTGMSATSTVAPSVRSNRNCGDGADGQLSTWRGDLEAAARFDRTARTDFDRTQRVIVAVCRDGRRVCIAVNSLSKFANQNLP